MPLPFEKYKRKEDAKFDLWEQSKIENKRRLDAMPDSLKEKFEDKERYRKLQEEQQKARIAQQQQTNQDAIANDKGKDFFGEDYLQMQNQSKQYHEVPTQGMGGVHYQSKIFSADNPNYEAMQAFSGSQFDREKFYSEKERSEIHGRTETKENNYKKVGDILFQQGIDLVYNNDKDIEVVNRKNQSSVANTYGQYFNYGNLLKPKYTQEDNPYAKYKNLITSDKITSEELADYLEVRDFINGYKQTKKDLGKNIDWQIQNIEAHKTHSKVADRQTHIDVIAKDMLAEARYTLNKKAAGAGSAGDFFGTMGHGVNSPEKVFNIIAMNIPSLIDNLAYIKPVATKLEKGEPLTEAENRLIAALQITSEVNSFRADNTSMAYGAGESATQSVAFMASMFVGMGYSGAAARALSEKIIAKTIGKGLGKYGTKAFTELYMKGMGKKAAREAAEAIEKKVIQGTSKAIQKDIYKQEIGRVAANFAEKRGIGEMAKGYLRSQPEKIVQSTIMAGTSPTAYNSIAEQRMGTIAKREDGTFYVDKNNIPTIGKAFLDAGIEIYSEMATPQLSAFLGRGLRDISRKFGISEMAAIQKISKTGIVKFFKDNPTLKERFAISNLADEKLEEDWGAFLRYLTGVTDKDEFKKQFRAEDQAMICLSLLPMGAVSGSANLAGYGVQKYSSNTSKKNLFKTMSEFGFEESEIKNFTDNLFNLSEQDIWKSVNKKAAESGMSSEQLGAFKQAVADYYIKESQVRNAEAVNSHLHKESKIGMITKADVTQKDNEKPRVTIYDGIGETLYEKECDTMEQAESYQQLVMKTMTEGGEAAKKLQENISGITKKAEELVAAVTNQNDEVVEASTTDGQQVFVLGEMGQNGTSVSAVAKLGEDGQLIKTAILTSQIIPESRKTEKATQYLQDYTENITYSLTEGFLGTLDGQLQQQAEEESTHTEDKSNKKAGETIEVQGKNATIVSTHTEEDDTKVGEVKYEDGTTEALDLSQVKTQNKITAGGVEFMQETGSGDMVSTKTMSRAEAESLKETLNDKGILTSGTEAIVEDVSQENDFVSSFRVRLKKKKQQEEQQPQQQQTEANAEQNERGYQLSNEVDENGIPFVKASDGSIEFGEITAEQGGLAPAPIRLSEGNNNYGLQHIKINHEEEILNAGYDNVIDFIEDVAKNFDTIKIGNEYNTENGVKPTYLIELTTKKNKTLFVELSKDGGFWNINSAGIFRENYSKNKALVWTLPALSHNSTVENKGVADSITNEKDSAGSTSGNSPQTSDAKVQQNSEAESTFEEEKSLTGGLAMLAAKFNNATKRIGFKATKVLPNGEKIKGSYVLVEANGVSPTHDFRTFAQTKGIPTREDGTTLNDRDYEKDKTAQAQVLIRANNYDGRAVTDMPIIDGNGIVLSGNDRTMSGQLAAENKTDGSYIESLTENIQQYGFSEEDMENFQHPRLVFMLDKNMDYTTENFAKFNANEKKTQNNVEKAIKVGKTIKPKTLRKIAGTINQYDSISDCWNSTNGTNEILSALVSDGQIGKNDMAQYINSNGTLNEAGKEYFETVLVGSILTEKNVRRVNEKQFLRQRIITALNQIIEINNFGEAYNLINEINEAIEVVYQANTGYGIKIGESLDIYYRQLGLFGESNIRTLTVQMLADVINQKQVRG